MDDNGKQDSIRKRNIIDVDETFIEVANKYADKLKELTYGALDSDNLSWQQKTKLIATKLIQLKVV
jgi:hypothetical protein